MRIRKNINCLSATELHNLREAFQALYDLPNSDPNSYHALASIHGGPPVVPSGQDGYCIHPTPGFLSWHRAYLIAFENALQRVRCGVTLPFWDWSSGPSNGIPPACREPTYLHRNGNTVPNPLYSAAGRFGPTSRSADANTKSFAGPASSAQSALLATDHNTFSTSVGSPHGWVHVLVGGDMGSVPTAGFDPVFWFHHANVDRLWDLWQRTRSLPMSSGEANTELEPFNKPYTQGWQKGSEMNSTSDLGYAYRTFCFLLPPILRTDWPIMVEIQPWIRERLRTARLVIHGDRMQSQPMTMEVRVSAKGDDKTVLAGGAGFIGHQTSEVTIKENQEPAKAANHGDHAHHHGEHAEMVASNDGRMLMRKQATVTSDEQMHDHEAVAAMSMETMTPGRFATSVELGPALRGLKDDVEQVAIHVQVRDECGNTVEPKDFHHTSVELVID